MIKINFDELVITTFLYGLTHCYKVHLILTDNGCRITNNTNHKIIISSTKHLIQYSFSRLFCPHEIKQGSKFINITSKIIINRSLLSL